MAFWFLMLFCVLLPPGIMTLAGRWMWKHPPEDINAWAGYRTKRSMASQQTWLFANRYCGRLNWRFGWVTMGISVLPMLAVWNTGEDTVSVVTVTVLFLELLPLFLSVFLTERALKKKF